MKLYVSLTVFTFIHFVIITFTFVSIATLYIHRQSAYLVGRERKVSWIIMSVFLLLMTVLLSCIHKILLKLIST